MDLAEPAQELGPEPQPAGAAGVVPGRRIGAELDGVAGDPGGGERRHGVGLGHVGIDRPPGIVPALDAGAAGPQPGGDEVLALRRVVAVLRADLEQRVVGKAAIGIAPRRIQEVGQERRPHRVEIGADRIGEAQARRCRRRRAAPSPAA